MAKKKATPRKAAKQPRLPGQEDAQNTALEDAARDYAEVRDQRQELTPHEVKAKEKVLELMKKARLKKYKRNGITITMKVEKENVTVRVREPEGEAA